MYADYDLATTGRVISDPARAAMLLRMMDGQAHTASDLARCAGVSASAASAHLRRLVDSRLVTVTVAGRRRLHTLSSAEVASAIEALALVSPLLPVESLRQAGTGSRLQIARACYSHLGGQLAVAITTELVGAGVVRAVACGEQSAIGSLDHPLLRALHITALPRGSAPAARGCQDWTERTPHLAGRLGSALMVAMLEDGWLSRRPRDRALTITERGTDQLGGIGIWPGRTAAS
ncbi:ArsR/SmtB family transcription factor [Nocardia sp. NPDC057227]|uniref:ArsR/SmtB family transcription factor n=1 Tax=Nocardia sp. NPDC057227 TaxID=3346056 RepID=UPI00363A72D8